MRAAAAGALAGLAVFLSVEAATDDGVRAIGGRRELFVDDWLIDRLAGCAIVFHRPQPAPPMAEPADNIEYATILLDGDLYRYYTRDARGAPADGTEPEVYRYAESRDGIHWTKPILRLHEIDGSLENNVILHEAPFCHNFSPFLDRRPGVPAEERFKAVAGTVKSGLFAFVSGDGIRWRKLRDQAVITYTKEYAFDSQNVAFWSESEERYVCYFRHFLDQRLRSVCRTTSADFVTWDEPVPLRPNFPDEHLYTTQTEPYYRAPHQYLAFPTRLHTDRGDSTDIMLMTSRGGLRFDRLLREAYLWPGPDPARWGNRANYAARGIVPTGPGEMSIYVTPFRRFTWRLDGLASIHAGADEAELLSRPLTFAGRRLSLNLATSGGGAARVEIQAADGTPLPGFTLGDSLPFTGDTLDHTAAWRGGSDVSALAGRPVRLRVVLREADLYALRFAEEPPPGR